MGPEMFEKLLRVFDGSVGCEKAGEQTDPAFAFAVLLIETARTDDRVTDRERRIIRRVLARRFGFSPDQVTRLVQAATKGAARATDLFHFTRVIVEQFTEQDRIALIEDIWQVALADGLDANGQEDTLLRRIAGLIDVSDHDRGEARRRAMRDLATK
jgi:uncharacterized tellurite resistance protein B-like protein